MQVREQAVRVITGCIDQLDKVRMKQAKQKARIEEVQEQV